jgi:phosphonate transport system substrate-binding protein
MLNDLRSFIGHCAVLALCLLLTACEKQEQAYQPTLGTLPQQPAEYVIGIFPVSNPQRLTETYAPLVDYLDRNIPEAKFRMEASHNFEDFESKLYDGYYHFALGNPYHTVQSLKYGYRIFAKMGDDEHFRGVILVRKDGGIQSVKDLKGKSMSYPSRSALAATMMPQYFLQTQGIDVNRDVANIYVGSQESSIMNVLRGRVAAGGVWLVSWKSFMVEHPDLAGQLQAKWTTGHLIDNGWVMHKNVPAPIGNKVANLLLHLHENEQGKMILQRLSLSRFDAASDATYQPVHDFLGKYSSSVRYIDH